MTLLSPLKLDTEESETKVMRQSFKSMPDRSSHMSFLHDGKRDWASIKHFWSALISQNQIASPPNNLTCSDDDFSISSPLSLPQWVIGCGEYGVTDIEAIHDCAKEELLGYHARGDKKKGNKRKTFGLRIGYDGSRYQGYQSQGAKGHSEAEGGGFLTVEDEVKKALGGLSSMSAGRTDKDVSAISQVVSCHSFDHSITPASLLDSFRNSPAVKEGRLTVFDCALVPKKFHALFSATWRRYLYLFPLQVRRKKEQGAVRMEAEAETETETETETKTETADATRWFPHLGVGPPSGKADTLEDNFEIDVDVDHINTLLHSLEGKCLSYNGFAYKDLQKTNRGALASRGKGQGGSAKDSQGDHDVLQQPAPKRNSESIMAVTEAGAVDTIGGVQGNESGGGGGEQCQTQTGLQTGVSELTGNGTQTRSERRYTAADAALDKCTLLRASATIVDLSHRPTRSGHDSQAEEPKLALCVELVGSRFLRRMVRILVATVIRECQLPQEDRDGQVLLKICQLGLRERSSLAITGEGLAMAGVGYDLASLSVPKFGTTTTNPKKLKRKAEKRARAEECERREGKLKVTDAAGVSDSSCTHE